MIPPVRMEPSVPSAVPSREALALLRILVVAGEGGSASGLLQNLRQWADDGRLEIDTAPDLPRAVRHLSGQRWDVVLAVLGEHPDDDLSWWVDTLRGATGSPRLIAVAQAPSMGLVLRAEKSGVLDVLALPLRREELLRALERVRSVVSETAVPLPLVEPHPVGPYALVGQSRAMLDVHMLLSRVAGIAALVLAQGRFRQVLYYRLAVVTIRLPALVERGDDLVLLTAYYVRLFAQRYGKKIQAISDRALGLLRAHAWVGNVRELRNVIERAVIVATDETLRAEHLPDELRGEEATLADRPQGGLLTLAEAEARHIARVLAHTNGQIGAAAEILGIHRNTLTRKMKEYGL